MRSIIALLLVIAAVISLSCVSVKQRDETTIDSVKEARALYEDGVRLAAQSELDHEQYDAVLALLDSLARQLIDDGYDPDGDVVEGLMKARSDFQRLVKQAQESALSQEEIDSALLWFNTWLFYEKTKREEPGDPYDPDPAPNSAEGEED